MIQRLRSRTKAIVYYLVDSLVRSNSPRPPDTLLLIRTDAIGDYVLFRNFIEITKKSEKYKHYRITLVGNIAWKELSIEFDDQFVDEFIWVDISKFKKNLCYRYSTLKRVTGTGYDVLINSMYSREFYTSETITKHVSANTKIASAGDTSNLSLSQKRICDQFYDDLVPVKRATMFEFYRNRDFFQTMLNENMEIEKPVIRLAEKKMNIGLPDSFTTLFIGGSTIKKKWSAQNFAKVAHHLKHVRGEEIVLCGGPADRVIANEFSNHFPGHYLDLVGKTSMVELLYVLERAALIVSNDTVAPHFAASLGKANILVLYSGVHAGRFIPYPQAIVSNFKVVYHPEIAENLLEYTKISNSAGYVNNFDINEIDTRDVIREVTNI
jgi:ADP-heptose:LPS heptosyltransferase